MIVSVFGVFKKRIIGEQNAEGSNEAKWSKETIRWVAVVAVFGCFGNYLAIAGIEHVYLAVASLLNNTLPIFVIIVAYFMLKETLNWTQGVAIALAFAGIVLMSMNSL